MFQNSRTAHLGLQVSTNVRQCGAGFALFLHFSCLGVGFARFSEDFVLLMPLLFQGMKARKTNINTLGKLALETCSQM